MYYTEFRNVEYFPLLNHCARYSLVYVFIQDSVHSFYKKTNESIG